MAKFNPHNIKPAYPNKFYVYELLKPNGDVFYVGKGKGRRINCHFWKNSLKTKSLKNNIIKKYGNSIIRRIVAYFDNESDAYDLEEFLISFYKTHSDGGKLSNILKTRDEISINCREACALNSEMQNPRLCCDKETTIKIYKMYFTECKTKREIANFFNLHPQAVRSRVTALSQKKLYEEYVVGGKIEINREYSPDPNPSKDLNLELLVMSRQRWLDGEYLSVISKEFGICQSTLKRIYIGVIRKGLFDTYHERPKNYKGKQ